MSSQTSSSIRFSCPQCGGNVKAPALQAGQRCRCPRCDAQIVAPGGVVAAPSQLPEAADRQTSAKATSPGALEPTGRPAAAPAAPAILSASPPAASVTAPMWPQPGSDAAPLRPAPLASAPLDDDEFGVDCRLCGTRLHVRRKQIGDTVKCPDCHSPVLVKAPPQRKPTQPAEVEEAELFKLSEAVELPSRTDVVPRTPVERTAPGRPPASETTAGPGSAAGGGTAMQAAARLLLEKVKAEQEAEAAEERERSTERFTQDLFVFFADRHALARLAILAVWLQVAMILRRWAAGTDISENTPAIFGEATGLLATVALAVVGLPFLYAAAACGWALVQDTSDGLRKIENWPGMNFIKWERDVFCIISAGFLAALPGAALGIVLAVAGIPGTLLLTAAASFVGLFPPMLLSMLEAKSALAPVDNAVWVSIRERPDPWKLTYLIIGVFTVGGLMGFYASYVGSFPAALAGATAMVACAMICFRTVGRLSCFLAGRDEKPAAGP